MSFLLFFFDCAKNASGEKVKEKSKEDNNESTKTNNDNKESTIHEKKSTTNEEELKIVIIDTRRKVEITIEEVKNESILLTLLRFLIAFLIISTVITTFLFVLLCFFKVYNFFLVEKESLIDISIFVFVKTL